MRGGGRPVPAGTRVVVYDIPLVSRNWNTTLLFRENKIFVFSLNNFALIDLLTIQSKQINVLYAE